MSPLVVLIAVIFVALIILAVIKGAGAHKSGQIGYPYQPAKQLFSQAERSFLGVLDQAVGSDFRVFGKVRVADVALVKTGLSKSARQGALNKIAYKHFDYVVCKSSDLSVVCAIELNDKSHGSKRAQARDELLSKVCEVIGLKLIAFPAKASYSIAEVKAQLSSALAAEAPIQATPVNENVSAAQST